MKLIVGLGNPGEKYRDTRHNLGQTIVMHLAQGAESAKKTGFSTEQKLKSEIARFDWTAKKGNEPEPIVVALPLTFMNDSGAAVSLIMHYHKIQPEDIWVVYDELDLPVGAMKIRFGGAAAGHHGVEDIIEKIGTDKFWRFRMGIGTTKQHIDRRAEAGDGKKHTIARTYVRDASDFVLGQFTSSEQTDVKKLMKNGVEALETALEKGIKTAQNRFNTK